MLCVFTTKVSKLSEKFVKLLQKTAKPQGEQHIAAAGYYRSIWLERFNILCAYYPEAQFRPKKYLLRTDLNFITDSSG